MKSKNSILQESSTFPIFASFYSVGLPNIFEISANLIKIPENYACNHPTHIFILIYVDNRKLTVFSLSLDTNNFIVAKIYQLVDQWLYSAKLSSNKDKRELMYYTQRKRDKTSSHINFTNHNSTISRILMSHTIYWLEVQTLFHYHITKIATKTKNTIICILMLTNTIHSPLHYYFHLLYYICILPIITYASTVW